ncbi:hypothetical protein [Streptomyces sp. DH12]|uniref:hypothetical protein n=1 Tax=Streptomyces sp. DH12 TaxID=2857010 RepID=UPI001E2A4EE2|nr:hypothetical protein [Streptomyces sp. DH12]
MSVEFVAPYSVASDYVTYKEAVDLLAETPHPVSESTVRRWVRLEGLPVERVERVDYVAFSDLLVVHAEKVAGRDL